MALTPHLAAWGKLQIDDALAAAGTSAAAVGLDKLGQTGVIYRGLEVPGGGAILAGLILDLAASFASRRPRHGAKRPKTIDSAAVRGVRSYLPDRVSLGYIVFFER